MSQANAETSSPAPALVTVEGLSAVVKSQKKLLFVSLGLAVLALLAAVAVFVLATANSSANEPEINPNDATIRHLESLVERILVQIEERESEAAQTYSELTELSRQVGRIDVNDERNAVIRLQRLAIKQEQDFRTFLSTLESGLYNFHMMIPHSRGWWDEYKADLDAALELSQAREEYATTLRDN